MGCTSSKRQEVLLQNGAQNSAKGDKLGESNESDPGVTQTEPSIMINVEETTSQQNGSASKTRENTPEQVTQLIGTEQQTEEDLSKMESLVNSLSTLCDGDTIEGYCDEVTVGPTVGPNEDENEYAEVRDEPNEVETKELCQDCNVTIDETLTTTSLHPFEQESQYGCDTEEAIIFVYPSNQEDGDSQLVPA